jgi:hypothetical protein
MCTRITGSLRLELFGPLRTVLRTTLVSSIDARGIQGSTDDVITNAGKILDSTAADEHD